MPQTEYQKQWYLDNRERELAKGRARYHANKGPTLIRSKARYEAMKNDPEWRENRRIKQRDERRERAVWWDAYKYTLQCSICGERRVPCLDFHHVDPTTKDFEVASMVYEQRSKEKILAEVDKCIVLCSNCHRMHHHNERS